MCLRLGAPFIHPDYLLDALDNGQLLDWERFDRQFGVGIHRDDIHWSLSRSEFLSANGKHKTARECNPYAEQRPSHDELPELSEEELDAMFPDDDGEWIAGLGLSEE